MDVPDTLGLSAQEAAAAAQKYGPNALPEEKQNLLLHIWTLTATPISFMLLAAAVLSWFTGKAPDAVIIFVLFLFNISISVWHEWKADTSIKELQKKLALSVHTKRGGSWTWIPSETLVPGDVIELRIGSLVPADARIIRAENLSINESVLTGESLPKEKHETDTAFSGSYVATGAGVAEVTETGARTFFGKTVTLVDKAKRKSALEKDILTISSGISILSIVVVVLLSVVFFFFLHAPLVDLITLDLSLLIAGIPVALPTVMSLIVSVGVVGLAKKQVIVRRLSSLEDLANVDLLLSDKTGTLSENKLHIAQVITFGAFSENDVVSQALDASFDLEKNEIDVAVAERAKALAIAQHPQVSVLPGDSERKRGTGIIKDEAGKEYVVSFGAPRVIAGLADIDTETAASFEAHLADAASAGFRVLAVAINKNGSKEEHMTLSGLLLISDQMHKDAPESLAFMRENGIRVVMVTGDNLEVSKRAASELGFVGEVYRRDVLDKDESEIRATLAKAAAFAEVLPKDKYAIVQAARHDHIVAVTGDGINDLPAVKDADVGFAVANAVDALKATADIVLLENGIARIKDAIIEARRIFYRLGNYSLFRISESTRLIITIAVLGLIYHVYPLTPLQLIALAFLNDVPIISLAVDRVRNSPKPLHADTYGRFMLGGMFGLAGIVESLVLFVIMNNILHLPWGQIETMFFLKLVVSGHLLIYVAHTSERWWKFLPANAVILATLATQILATCFAFFGILTTPISLWMVILVWVWSLIWMQVAEGMKPLKVLLTGSERSRDAAPAKSAAQA